MQLRLNPAQLEERKSHEAAVKEIEDQIGAEADEKKKDLLKVELAARQSKLDALMDRFVVRGRAVCAIVFEFCVENVRKNQYVCICAENDDRKCKVR